MFKRLKNYWNLYQLGKRVDDGTWEVPINEQGRILKSDLVKIRGVEGDGKAVFLGEGTTEEFEDQQKVDKGLLGWYNRIRNM